MFRKLRILMPVMILLSMAVVVMGAGIDGPEKITVGGSPAKFTITGATVSDLIKSEAKLIWYPRDTVSVWEAATWGGEPYILVSATKAGKYLVAISYVQNGKACYLEREVEAAGSDPIKPPQPGAKLQIVFAISSKQLDNLPRAQQALLASLTLREKLEAAGHRFVAVLDLDNPEAVPEALAPFQRAVAGKTLPRIAVAPVEGGTIVEYPMPAAEAELLKLVEVSQ